MSSTITSSSGARSVNSRTTDSAPANSRSPCSAYTRAQAPNSLSTSCSSGVRRRLDGAVPTSQACADRRAALAGHVQEVQLELARDLPAGGDAADAVAVAVQPRRVERDPDLAREHGEHAAADAALGRQPDVDDPLAGRVVHPAGGHHAQHALDDLGLEDALARARLHAAVGQRGGHQREVAGSRAAARTGGSRAPRPGSGSPSITPEPRSRWPIARWRWATARSARKIVLVDRQLAVGGSARTPSGRARSAPRACRRRRARRRRSRPR